MISTHPFSEKHYASKERLDNYLSSQLDKEAKLVSSFQEDSFVNYWSAKLIFIAILPLIGPVAIVASFATAIFKVLQLHQIAFFTAIPAHFLDRHLTEMVRRITYLGKCIETTSLSPRSDSFYVYNHLPIAKQSISRELQNTLNPFLAETFTLHQSKGVCHGTCLWQLLLFEKNKHHYLNKPRDLLHASVNRFRKGVPGEALLMHSFYYADRQKFKETLSIAPTDVNPIEKIETLANGAYNIALYGHTINYFKVSENEGYLFDPSTGLFPCLPAELWGECQKHDKSHCFGAFFYKAENILPSQLLGNTTSLAAAL